MDLRYILPKNTGNNLERHIGGNMRTTIDECTTVIYENDNGSPTFAFY